MWFVAFLSHHRFVEPQVLQPTLTVMHTHFLLVHQICFVLFCLKFDLVFSFLCLFICLDLEDDATFRDLSKPIGALNPERLARLKVLSWTFCVLWYCFLNILCVCFSVIFIFIFWLVCLSVCLFDFLCIGACLSLIQMHYAQMCNPWLKLLIIIQCLLCVRMYQSVYAPLVFC